MPSTDLPDCDAVDGDVEDDDPHAARQTRVETGWSLALLLDILGRVSAELDASSRSAITHDDLDVDLGRRRGDDEFRICGVIIATRPCVDIASVTARERSAPQRGRADCARRRPRTRR